MPLKIYLILFISVFLISSSEGQNFDEFSLLGAHARATGMADAFIGLADDASCLVYNPAGLSQLRKFELALTSRYKTVASEQNFNGEESNFYGKNLGIDYSSFVLPFHISKVPLAFGASYNTVEHYFQYNKSFSFASPNYRINRIRFGFGAQLLDWLSVGSTFNYGFSRVNEERLNDGRIRSNFIDLSGNSVTFGIIVDFKKYFPLKAGLVYESGSNYLYEYRENDSNGSTLVSEIIDRNVPGMFGLGLSCRVMDNFTLSSDYELRPYKSSTLSWRDNTGNFTYSGSRPFTNNFSINQFRIGGEYLIVLDVVSIPFRAGYKNRPTSNRNGSWSLDDFNNEIGGSYKQAVGHGFNLGTGLIWKRISLDFAYEFSKVSRSLDTFYPSYYTSLYNSVSRHYFNASLLYSFKLFE